MLPEIYEQISKKNSLGVVIPKVLVYQITSVLPEHLSTNSTFSSLIPVKSQVFTDLNIPWTIFINSSIFFQHLFCWGTRKIKPKRWSTWSHRSFCLKGPERYQGVIFYCIVLNWTGKLIYLFSEVKWYDIVLQRSLLFDIEKTKYENLHFLSVWP